MIHTHKKVLFKVHPLLSKVFRCKMQNISEGLHNWFTAKYHRTSTTPGNNLLEMNILE